MFTSPRFADHLTPPGHPERVERFEVMQVVASEFGKRGGRVQEPRRVTDEEVTRIHDADYLTSIKETAGRAVALDPDTFTSPGTFEAAYAAAGAAVTAVEHVLDGGPGTRALAMVRPPGHHAERNRAMGFCLFNNIAIAAAHARARAAFARGHRGLRRPSRQRHAVELLQRSIGAVHLIAPVSVLSGNRCGRRDRYRRRRRLHGQSSAQRGRHRRGLRAASTRRWRFRSSRSFDRSSF